MLRSSDLSWKYRSILKTSQVIILFVPCFDLRNIHMLALQRQSFKNNYYFEFHCIGTQSWSLDANILNLICTKIYSFFMLCFQNWANRLYLGPRICEELNGSGTFLKTSIYFHGCSVKNDAFSWAFHIVTNFFCVLNHHHMSARFQKGSHHPCRCIFKKDFELSYLNYCKIYLLHKQVKR